jgi:hypothetical protein
VRQWKSLVAQPCRRAYDRFLAFSARTGADREGQQRVDLMRSQAASGTVGPGSGFLADTDRLCRTVSAWRVDHVHEIWS